MAAAREQETEGGGGGGGEMETTVNTDGQASLCGTHQRTAKVYKMFATISFSDYWALFICFFCVCGCWFISYFIYMLFAQ